jgi:Amt family ammonium transporter
MTGKKGLCYGGGWDLLGKQLVAVLVLGLFSFGMTALIGKAVDLTVGLRQSSAAEEHEQVYQNDWDAQFKEIADALLGGGEPGGAGSAGEPGGTGSSEPPGTDASALLDQVRRMLAADPQQLRD